MIVRDGKKRQMLLQVVESERKKEAHNDKICVFLKLQIVNFIDCYTMLSVILQ